MPTTAVTLLTTRSDLANALCRTNLLSDWHERADKIIELLDSDEPPAIEVELVESIDFASIRVTLPSGHTSEVTATNYSHFGGAPQPQVNWKSIGSCDPDDAIAYAKAILAAAALAKRLNSESEEG